ncbi:MAG: ATP-binding cassette domain-containing protein [Bacillota bacterium]
MLELRNLVKKYEIGTFKQTALNNVSLTFQDNEFVAVLGPSGSGKTTLLNMVGGLDRYDDGDILIDGKSTKGFSNREWDAYRNHAVGFIFQNYNLITHTSVLFNVEVGMTLSGVSASERRERAVEVLERVGLKDHIHKKPNQLSGGQMQRVAIARALVNNPKIILADEPTGAIDSETSAQIMNLIREIAKDKLVIMVTHDENVARRYANRIIDLKDGEVLKDSRPSASNLQDQKTLSFKKTSMAFVQALKLSFNNLRTKKFRTLITAFAGSIGIIGVALVLSLANGLNNEIDRLEESTLAEFPIQIDRVPFDIDNARGGGPYAEEGDGGDQEIRPDDPVISPYEESEPEGQHTNTLNLDYLDHVNELDESLYNEIDVERNLDMKLLKHTGDDVINVNTDRINFSEALKNESFFEDNYDLLEGSEPQDENDLLIVVDEYNRLNAEIFNALELESNRDYEFSELMDMEFKVAFTDEYYVQRDDSDSYRSIEDLDAFFESDDGLEMEISGIARAKEDSVSDFLSPGFKYHPDLTEMYFDRAENAPIVEDQMDTDENLLLPNSPEMNEEDKTSLLRSLGADEVPSSIQIYPESFESKDEITDHLDEYNEDKSEDDEIIYTDIASIVTDLTGEVIDGISYVLVAFSAISLIVSSIMIGIITYVSVLERTKEIGILRSLGARKKDISRVFNAETLIIGFTAGVLGILVAYVLTFPINWIIQYLVDDIGDIAVMPLYAVFLLIFISMFLTFVAGLIPSRFAANKDPVEALRVD